ncbi:nitroreductase [Alloalcanivorax xenomutans]|jgi:nitroreductase|uniref:Nitroreductase n=1 Tax=Alloalcanivorax xenomutans TaxID=1094342 RepID=A0A9Q3W3X2_9GAMM|nr:nitroreductase [Alloalcanivorax xenomutans]ERS14346.1 NADH dehydrogenase [Alcanivorax sp. PN-3]KYZ85548.1 NADH dehydrogenase [Alcanivorax sp. KX64203]MBA4721860.1 nitroreductase [Alcanivorax sp.]ARB47497.1 NADH dehydrogenase [Alloalcanivorax xenomutans]MCE7508039.1 nitroreductase [Alloalcanivorax xenomutans]|tara:strand:+ start:236 stop:922 length:687 start_codon:yes stop_codon:yes gene_type:complete
MTDAAKTVSEALESRRSIRAFQDRPVDGALLRAILEKASRAPSGGNLQPWHLYVVGGERLDQFKAIMRERLQDSPGGENREYDVYPPNLIAPYRDRRFQVGEDMYGLLGIPRDDKAARLRWFANNFQFFGAPVALFCYVHRTMGPPQWSDLGMYLQSVMLLLREAGLDSCPQECWSLYPQTLGEFLQAPDEWMLFTGMSIGYRDENAEVNQLRAKRAPLDEIAEFHGL